MTNVDFLATCSDDEWFLVVKRGQAMSSDEVLDFLTEYVRLVLLNHMATVSNHLHLIPALHVRHSQLSVHSLCPGQKQHLFGLQAQEALCQSVEPFSPKLLSGH